MAFEVVMVDGSRQPLKADEKVSAIGEMARRCGIKSPVTSANCDAAKVWGLLETEVPIRNGRGTTEVLRWPKRDKTFPPKGEQDG